MASDSRWPRPTLWAALGPGTSISSASLTSSEVGSGDRGDFGQRLQKGFPEIVGGININEFERGNIYGNDSDFSEAEPAEVAGPIHELESCGAGLGGKFASVKFCGSGRDH